MGIPYRIQNGIHIRSILRHLVAILAVVVAVIVVVVAVIVAVAERFGCRVVYAQQQRTVRGR